jgi:Flp pilus assembly protein TadB
MQAVVSPRPASARRFFGGQSQAVPSQRGSRRDALPKSYFAINLFAVLLVSVVLPDEWSLTRSLLVGVPIVVVTGIGLLLFVRRRARAGDERATTRGGR